LGLKQYRYIANAFFLVICTACRRGSESRHRRTVLE
jgi:hypothetical protein